MWRTGQAEERLLVQYLLGNLPEGEMAEVEDRAFADKAYLNRIEAVEADMIDAYVRGDWKGGELRSFELRFLASPKRRKKVEFARALARLAEEAVPAPVAKERATWWQWRGLPAFAYGLSALACVAAISWLAAENRSMRFRVAGLESRGGELELRNRALQTQLDQERARSVGAGGPSGQVRLPAAIASLLLLPGGARGHSAAAQLVLPEGAPLARIECQMEGPDDYARFRAELRSAGGGEVLTAGNLQRRRSGGGFAVTLDVPASALPAGPYELALKGVAPDDSLKEIGYYYFTVRRN